MILLDNIKAKYEKIIAFNNVLCPLMLAISEHVKINNTKQDCDIEAMLLAKLDENVIAISKEYAKRKNIAIDSDIAAKWKIMSNVTKLVTANYKKTKDVLEYNDNISNMNLEQDENLNEIKDDEDFKSSIFEVMASIVNVISRFSFAKPINSLILSTEMQINNYAQELLATVDIESEGEIFNAFYAKTVKNLTELFSICYYSEIDALLEVPLEERESFIHNHMVENSDSIEKALDVFYNRVKITSNVASSVNSVERSSE